MKFNTKEEVLKYIEKKTNFQLGLLRVEDFLQLAQIDYASLKYIHVGGTNGKGSVSYYLSNILIENKYKTGFFSSPSIEVHNDRIRINNEFIDDQSIVDFVNKYYDIIEQTQVTMFEIDVLMALDYFVKNKVDIVVMEVGMGGRYDGTNVINPLVSIITNIGLDHMDYLGKTKEEIAYTKAGIIKKDSIIITNEKEESVLKVIEDYAFEMNAKILKTGNALIKSKRPIVFDYKNYHDIQLKTYALYQVENMKSVLETIDVLKDVYHFKFDEAINKNVFNKISWNGRFEIISEKPLIIIDGAHNVEGIKALVQSLEVFNDYKKTIMFSALIDKETDEMVNLLKKTNSEIIISEFDFYRKKKAEEINKNFNFEIALDYKRYIDNKIRVMKDNDLFLITGSLYFISEVRKYLLNTLNK